MKTEAVVKFLGLVFPLISLTDRETIVAFPDEYWKPEFFSKLAKMNNETYLFS
jgi:hypothetical protein